MKNTILALFLLFGLNTFSQNATGANGNTIDGSYEMYRTMSPGSTSGNRKVWFKLRDSIYVYFHQDSVAFKYLSGTGNRLVISTPSGRLKNISYTTFTTPIQVKDSLTVLRTALGSKYLLITDTTSKWQKKGTYLTSYTETDPLWITSPSHGITGTNVTNWNTAFGWGNHASAGYLTSVIASSTYQPIIGYTPYNGATNPNGYLSSVSWSAITGKPTFSTVATSGLYSDLIGLPTLFNGDYNNLTNKPTIPTNTNQLTNGSGFLTAETDPLSVHISDSLTMLSPYLKKTGNGSLLTNMNKGQVGLGNADNTSDASKPVSTATQTALNLKVNISDTSSMLSPYLKTATANTNYYTKTATDAKYALISDTFPSGKIMTSNAAMSSINTLTTNVNGKQSQLNGAGFVKATGTTISYDNSVYLTAEVDGSVTNEIELPSQTGQSGKMLSTNGSSVSWQAPSSSPASGNSPSGYLTGTGYNLTTSSAKISGGTTSSTVTLPSAGTYLILSNVKVDYVGLTTLVANSATFKLRRTNNTAGDLSNTTAVFNIPILTLLTQTAGDADIQTITYTTATTGDVIEIWGSLAGGVSLGNVRVNEAGIVAIKIY